MQCILSDEVYSRLIAALVAHANDNPGSTDPDAYKIMLGEIASIWPESVLASYVSAKEVE